MLKNTVAYQAGVQKQASGYHARNHTADGSEEVTLSNRVLQGAKDVREEQAPISGVQVRKYHQLLHFLRIKAVEHVCWDGLWLLVLPPAVQKLLTRMPKDVFMQGSLSIQKPSP